MTEVLPPRDWADIRWPQIDKAATSDWIAVLPLAATEQHGPHLPLSTDTDIANAYLAKVRAILLDDIPATFLPVQSVGISIEHTDYPGTQTLSTNAALKSWMALGEGVANAGLRKLVIVTSHGGNAAAMQLVAQDLRAQHKMLVVTTSWSRFGVPENLFPEDELHFGIHGGAVETSIMLAAYPQLVKKDRIANFASAARAMQTKFRWLSASRPAPFAWMAQDLNPQGAIGNATLATAEKGDVLLDHGAHAFSELLADVKAFDLANLNHKPISAE